MNTSFPSLRIEGGLLSGEIIDKIAEASSDIPGQKPVDFGLESNRPLIDEIASAWNDARSYWALFQKSMERLKPDDPGTTFTRDRWMVPFFSLLGYNLQPQRKAAGIEGASYFISHRGGTHEQAPPIHITGFRQSLDRRAESGVPRLAPHSLVQEYLNRSEELWGIVTNGFTLRLLRDSHLIRRQAYIEFDLKEIMEGDRFADFALLYRIIHATRLPKGIDDADKCLLEQYHRTTVEQGGRVRDHLRDGVQRALIRFGSGFLNHPKNSAFRADVGQKTEEPFEYYQQLLRIIYRFLFLMVSEERGLISDNELYRQHYSITRIRNLAGTAAAYNEFEDLWAGLRATFSLFTDESIGRLLQVPPLNGDLFDPTRTDTLNPLSLSNRDLLHAMWDLSMYREKEKAPWRRINYAALDVEELGSVYESLLEFQPVFSESDGKPTFDLLTGTERKSTGSYYTPPELVNELIQSALVPVIRDRLKEAKTPAEKEQQLLGLTVCDPACGSGHFLLAAARRIGRELAIARTGDEEPSPEQMRLAIRDVITHCIYGVDKNPLAVDLCKVALWLEGHTTSKPLTFLDHRIRCGDSLIGVFDLSVLKEGIPDEAFTAVIGDDKAVAREIKKQNKKEREHRQLGEFDVAMGVLTSSRQQVNAIADDRPEDIRRKRELFSSYQQEGTAWCKDKTACDLWAAAFFVGLTKENEETRIIPTTNTVREYLAGRMSADNLQVKTARGLANQYWFFHWPLEFPEVFGKGGFDCVLGNPPWEKVKLVEKKWFIGKDQEIATSTSQTQRASLIKKLQIKNSALFSEWVHAQVAAARTSAFFFASHRFSLSAVGDLNTYPLFTELCLHLINSRGKVGVVVKTGIATDYSTKDLFGHIVENKGLVSIFDFINSEGIFPAVAPPERFCLLTLTGKDYPIEHAEFSFSNTNFTMLYDRARRYRLTPAQILKINPNTRNCPIFHIARDRDITVKIYERFPVLIYDTTDENPWGIKYHRIFDMANDSGLFAENTCESLKEKGYILGRDGIYRKDNNTYLPLWEGKFFHHFDHRFGTFEGIPKEQRFIRKAKTVRVDSKRKIDPYYEVIPRYWVKDSAFFKKVKEIDWNEKWIFVYRDITNTTTNFRTAMGNIIPFFPIGHTTPALTFTVDEKEKKSIVFSAFFDSIIFDYITRQTLGGTHFTLFILKQLPMPTPDQIHQIILEKRGKTEPLEKYLIHRAIRLIWTSHALDPLGNVIAPGEGPYTWNDDERRVLRAEIDAAVAHVYGVTQEEFEYILDTFTILRDKEIEEYGEYRTKRNCLEMFNEIKIR